MKAMGQCLHFGKSVQDNGYGMFREMLDYKLAWQGKKMVKVDRFFVDQRGLLEKYVNKDGGRLRLSGETELFH